MPKTCSLFSSLSLSPTPLLPPFRLASGVFRCSPLPFFCVIFCTAFFCNAFGWAVACAAAPRFYSHRVRFLRRGVIARRFLFVWWVMAVFFHVALFVRRVTLALFFSRVAAFIFCVARFAFCVSLRDYHCAGPGTRNTPNRSRTPCRESA